MANPTSRAEFIATCRRRLGEPVAKVNVTEEQADDRVDEALKYFFDYHFSGADLHYYKHVVTANNYAQKVYDCTVVSGGTGYANTDTVVFTNAGGSAGSNAAAAIITDGSGVITSCTLSDNGKAYGLPPTVSVTSNTGTGASITCELGGWIPIPENIIGIVRLFPIGFSQSSTQSIFNIRYQIALNDLYNLTSSSIVPYFSAFQNLGLLEEILVGQIPVRYNRHKDRMYLDMDWNITNVGDVIVAEAYQIVDPDVWTDAWSDRWLLDYGTALIKLQWGNNMKKFQGTMLPGGVAMNGQGMFDEATAEIAAMREEMITKYSLPSTMFIG